LLSQLWRLQPELSLLHRIAQRLGADVPVCLASRTTRMAGIGERLEAAPPLPSCGLVLVNPGLPVSTQAVFRSRDPGFSLPAQLADCWPDAHALAADLGRTHNDLQAAAIRLCPTIDLVLARIASEPDCLLARMSGSGATCFGLFPDAGSAERAAEAIGRHGWWAWGGATG
jgi:4-diphosphocytidyl-2-C-methyl-D-erythritol kinase